MSIFHLHSRWFDKQLKELDDEQYKKLKEWMNERRKILRTTEVKKK
jgi:mRNA-degrading endonuclease RelE of RelBE toxin-antitoxin system